MDPHLFWTDMIMNPVETQNLPGSPVFASDANVSYIDLSGEDSADMSIWNSGGPSSSRTSRRSLDQSAHDQNKMEHGCASSLTINGGQGSRTEERQLETTNMLLGSRIEGRGEATNVPPVENINLDLNRNQVDGSQSFLQSPSFIRNADHNTTHAGRSSLVLEAGQFSIPIIPGSLGSGHVPSSGGPLSLSGSSSRGAGFSSERGEGLPGNSFDGRRLSCKRKSIEGVSAQCSASGSPSCIYQGESGLVHSVSARQSANTTLSISSSSNYPSGANPPGEQMNPRIGTAVNVGTSDHHSFNVPGSTESSQRNCRIRINSPIQLAASLPNQWPPGNSLRSSDLWSTYQAANPFVPFNQSLNSRVAVAGGTSDGQSPILPVPSLAPNIHPFPVHVTSSSRTGSSSRSPAIAGQRSSASREETNSRSRLPRNNILETSVPVPIADISHLMSHSSSWSLAPASQAGTSSQVVQSSGPTWIPHQNPPSQYQRRLPVVARRSLVPSIPSGSGQSINVPPQPSGPSNTLQQELSTSAAVLRNLQHMRSANGVLGDPTSVRALAMRESRSRVLSEIRNALARRGEFEGGVYSFDPAAVFYGGAADLHDRHRDMRLDVDNMSYEELLALTERIGHVNTGISEETIMKCLKQRKYISLTNETPSEVEPCCVCQEEYVEEDDVGRLDCGHDFHTACIKQWLMMKNLCPICKTTGLVASKER